MDLVMKQNTVMDITMTVLLMIRNQQKLFAVLQLVFVI